MSREAQKIIEDAGWYSGRPVGASQCGKGTFCDGIGSVCLRCFVEDDKVVERECRKKCRECGDPGARGWCPCKFMRARRAGSCAVCE